MKLDQVIPEGTTLNKTWGTTPEGGDSKVDKVKVQGVIDYSGLTIKQLMEIAAKPIIITYQKLERVMGEIPKNATVEASIALPQTKKTKTPRIATVDELTNEQAQKMLEDLLARQSKSKV